MKRIAQIAIVALIGFVVGVIFGEHKCAEKINNLEATARDIVVLQNLIAIQSGVSAACRSALAERIYIEAELYSDLGKCRAEE